MTYVYLKTCKFFVSFGTDRNVQTVETWRISLLFEFLSDSIIILGGLKFRTSAIVYRADQTLCLLSMASVWEASPHKEMSLSW